MKHLLATLLLLTTTTLLAQDKNAAYTSLENVPETFWLQGEYLGTARLSSRDPYRVFGLQIATVEETNFQAALFPGGLPGEGWNRQEPIHRKGTLEDGRAVFASEDQSFTLTADGAQAIITPVSSPVNSSAQPSRLRKIGRASPTLGLRPPAGAKLLFTSGNATQHWQQASLTDDGLLKEGALTKDSFGDMRLHTEFQIAYKPGASEQGRGNSGIYIQRRYEVQILDSFAQPLEFNYCGAIYRQRPPELNMTLPPLAWQTYDIWFRAARFDNADNKTENARITVWHNGIPIHRDYEITTKTGHGQPEGPDPLPINLQDHNNPVRFRNVWLLEGDIKPPTPLTARARQSAPIYEALPQRIIVAPAPGGIIPPVPIGW